MPRSLHSYSRLALKHKGRTGIQSLVFFHHAVLKCLACSIVAFVLLCRTYTAETRNVLFKEEVMDAYLLDRLAVTESRIRATRRGVFQQQYFPLADQRCSLSLGEVKLMRWDKRHLVCYGRDYARLFQRADSLQGVNLLVCDQDCVRSPRHVFTVAKSRPIENAVNRTVTLLPLNVGRHFRNVPAALRDGFTYKKKLPVAIWRGSTTGLCWDLPMGEKMAAERTECARRNLVTTWATKGFDNIDIGLTNIVQLSKKIESKYSSLVKKEMSIHDMLQYRYIISVEGNDVATNLKWALASNSVVFMPPPTRESIILESTLYPWIHYVPLSHDFSDLQVKIKYCDDNPLVCQNISSTATKFMLPFSTRSNIFSLGARILEAFVTEMKGLGIF